MAGGGAGAWMAASLPEEARPRVGAAAVGVGAAEGLGQVHAAAPAPEELQARSAS